MYLAYLDESGDPGLVRSPTVFYVLSCVLVHDSRWLETLDRLIEMRRRLRTAFGIPPSAEIKGSHFKVKKGVFRNLDLSIEERMELFSGLLKYQRRLPIKVFAIAIEKAPAAERDHNRTSQELAWLMALQRIHTFCKKVNPKTKPGEPERPDEFATIFPDEGHNHIVRRLMRKLRRHHTVPQFWGEGYIKEELTRIIEDPNDRASHLSYFSQLADWNAYAAHKSQYIAPDGITPPDAWNELDRVMLRAVNQITGGPPAIVKWPR